MNGEIVQTFSQMEIEVCSVPFKPIDSSDAMGHFHLSRQVQVLKMIKCHNESNEAANVSIHKETWGDKGGWVSCCKLPLFYLLGSISFLRTNAENMIIYYSSDKKKSWHVHAN